MNDVSVTPGGGCAHVLGNLAGFLGFFCFFFSDEGAVYFFLLEGTYL